ncbi:porin family protein [Sphingobacterium sp. SRCM116780]|uniref:porin family protein n=1 Tax=Sphingobacterium sp. SRCM116780 TaxID=2907623 RepID=UPI001F1EAD07|nr:porin family protein [Sphingobacterium sp. SRCM116780]UIR55635.1 porin family protein [Sphingobacterium sp. SRCM116780]
MKNLFITLLCILSIGGLSVQAQTKKPIRKTVSTTKHTETKKATKTVSTESSAKLGETAKTEEQLTIKSTRQSPEQSRKNTSKNTYKAAFGIKFIYGISLTGKVFIKERSALEGILRYNGAGGTGSNIAFTGLYEYHTAIKGVDGLRWYVGGGGHINYFNWKDADLDPVITFGIAGIAGLEYKFANLPLAVSVDWQPAYIISNNGGFSAENGGVGLKYTF